MKVVVRSHLVVRQRICNDPRRKGHKDGADVPDDGRAGRINDETRFVEVDADDPALLFDSHLHLPTHVFVLGAGVLPDKNYERAGHVDALAALALDVRLVVGVDFLSKLAIGEVEVDVLAFFPREHQAVAVNVGTAEADKSPRNPHLFTPTKIVITF